MNDNQTEWSRFARAFLRNKAGIGSLFVIIIFVVVAVFPAFIAPYDPYEMDLRNRFVSYSAEHLVGTDMQGRDVFSRLVFGTRITLLIGLGSVAFAGLLGSTIGFVGGYFRKIEGLLMRIMDVWLAFPSIIIALTITAITGAGLYQVIFAVGMGQLPQFARLAFSYSLTYRDKDFVEAARALGVGDVRILFRHIVPNCVAPMIVQATLFLPAAILSGAGLSFLGMGVQPPLPEWGLILGVAKSYLREAPHMMIGAGLAMSLVVISFNVFGDALRDTLDPKTRNS